ncbi:MAG: OmpH family outer membrane protein [Saprospiraceae bacterium]|nr:OmpH family outer membrane protein [Saprospiraceae bacterium]MCB0675347.1 OmpH family outer membrane protein [Saprospiraceae bacterium]MCB0682184.1 OmpH family outer membrane protein [Saprospiraceae bacterium]
MIYWMKRGGISLLLILAVAVGSQAQKFGYLNSAELLSKMPETQSADASLKSYRDGLVSKGQKMAEDLQNKYLNYMEQANSGAMTPVQMQSAEAELQQDQQKLAAYEQEVMDKVQKKRQELYTPILEKVQTAIEEVGKEQSYEFIFDVGVMNVLLFAEESDNVAPLVKKKLNL